MKTIRKYYGWFILFVYISFFAVYSYIPYTYARKAYIPVNDSYINRESNYPIYYDELYHDCPQPLPARETPRKPI